MQRRFQVVIFYENQEALDRYLYNFSYDKPIKTHKRENELYYEYEHFEIKCFKQLYSQCFRGWKCDLIAVEKPLTEYNMWNEFKNNISLGMLVPQRFKIDVQIFE